MNRFELFLSQLKETNSTLGSFTDFDKVRANTKKVAIKLNQLNYLIGQNDLHGAIKELFDENPKVFDVLEILIAVRSKDKRKVINKMGDIVLIENYFHTVEGVIEYIEQTGLASVFQNKDITNLVDYVFGIEVGLDTNARKNRGGDDMAKAVEAQLRNAGVDYACEVYSDTLKDFDVLGDDSKRFDFVIYTDRKTFLIETNFYNGGGSKLNEVARAYTELAPKINDNSLYEFVWITDGKGWEHAQSMLREAFNTIPRIYNLTSLQEFLMEITK